MFDNSLWTILAIVIAASLMIVFPIVHLFEKREQIVRLEVLSETDVFLDTIKAKGYIDVKDYTNFKRKLDLKGYLFDVVLEHERKEYVPVYGNPMDINTFTKTVKVVSEVFTDREIKDVLFVPDEIDNNMYKMSRGDVFTVIVSSKTKTQSDKLKEMFLNIKAENSLYIRLSGVVQNEAY